TRVLVTPSNLFSKNWGMVVSPIFRYLGIKKIAAITKAMEEVTSQAMTIKPLTYEFPFIPIRCSDEILVSSIDPAITTPVKLLPPKKYPSNEAKFDFLRLYHVKKATPPVKRMKEVNIIIRSEFIRSVGYLRSIDNIFALSYFFDRPPGTA